MQEVRAHLVGELDRKLPYPASGIGCRAIGHGTGRRTMKTLATAAIMLTVASTALAQRSTLDRFRVAQASLACGLAPLPPLGCRVGACVCDQYGRNCQWTFVCR